MNNEEKKRAASDAFIRAAHGLATECPPGNAYEFMAYIEFVGTAVWNIYQLSHMSADEIISKIRDMELRGNMPGGVA